MTQAVFAVCREKNCRESAISFSDFCWGHTEKKSYAARLADSLASLGGSKISLNLKKAEFEGVDFSGLDLGASNLSQAKITGSLFIGTALAGSDFIGARFHSCDFVGADMHHSNFTRSVFIDCSFSHADLADSNFVEAHFRDVDFMGSSLVDAVLWNADLAGARNLKRKNFGQVSAPGAKTRLSEKDALMAHESYRSLKRHFYQRGLYEDASWAAYQELTLQRKHFFESRDVRFIPSFLMDVLSGYTEKPARVILSSFGIVFFFGVIYYLLNALRPTMDEAGAGVGFWDSLYFSFITFTTVGFGDFIPKVSLGVKILVALEAFSGPFMAGLFVFTLTRRYAVS